MIDYFSLGHPLARLRSHYALTARKRMLKMFLDVFQPTGAQTVLDLGATPDSSLPESNFFEQLYPFPDQVTAASIEDLAPLALRFPKVRCVRFDGRSLPFADRSFDLLFCSAVIEHVGTREQQRLFVHEALRVAKAFMFTTPNRLFPIEMHTLLPLLHWLPQSQHQALLRAIGKSFWAETSNLNLLTAGTLRSLFPPSQLTIRSVSVLGWPSNLIAYGEN